ncbi:hypothetical protein [Pseudovibrio ascidiaceicola]|uniref:hypothetical protein n=1 Tax=Pseudovibrio ascidiaceicola TaxID=285279 RepID=UPI000D68DA0B|nr:hypothetical protein [Pseudovibrio ascidiaceicola]
MIADQQNNQSVAISISEADDMHIHGFTDLHLRDAMTILASHLLSQQLCLVYGGDLRANGFTKLLFELVARYQNSQRANPRATFIKNCIAWPVHINMPFAKLQALEEELRHIAQIQLFDLDGKKLSLNVRKASTTHKPCENEWIVGLSSMRTTISKSVNAQIVLGGRTENYKGALPGIAEEALLAIKNDVPLYLLGGFGGCTLDICETLKITAPWRQEKRAWAGKREFLNYSEQSLNNGLTTSENRLLSSTPYINQAIPLILTGLKRLKVI